MTSSEVFAAAGVVIAVAALTVSVYQSWLARDHNRRSVRPALVLETRFRAGETAGLRLTSAGLGPAVLVRTAVWVDGSLIGPFNKNTADVVRGEQRPRPSAHTLGSRAGRVLPVDHAEDRRRRSGSPTHPLRSSYRHDRRMTSTGVRGRSLVGVVAVVLATVATWWGWLGWDNEYQVDPVTGQASGPYEAWQVVGCVLCLIAIVVLGVLTLRPWLAPAALTVTFSGVWSWWAGSTDDSGLWLVGAILVFAGLAWGSAAVSVLTWLGSRVVRREWIAPA